MCGWCTARGALGRVRQRGSAATPGRGSSGVLRRPASDPRNSRRHTTCPRLGRRLGPRRRKGLAASPVSRPCVPARQARTPTSGPKSMRRLMAGVRASGNGDASTTVPTRRWIAKKSSVVISGLRRADVASTPAVGSSVVDTTGPESEHAGRASRSSAWSVRLRRQYSRPAFPSVPSAAPEPSFTRAWTSALLTFAAAGGSTFPSTTTVYWPSRKSWSRLSMPEPLPPPP